MPRFVLMTRLAASDLHDVEARRDAGRQWLGRVRETLPDVHWIEHYALLGPYDFMDVYDAPDVETAHKVSLLSRAEGAITAESWQAIPYEKHLEALKSLGH